MLATRGSGKVTTMEARANKTKGIRCLERTLLGQSARKHMLDLYLCATSANFTIMDRALTPAKRQAENKWKLDNTSKNNQNQQQPNKRQNTGRAYIAGHEEKKHYSGSKLLGTGASQKANCYKCGNQGHYRNDCPERNDQNHENQTRGTGAHRVVHAFGGGETEQDLNNIEDDIDA
ncbi:reverse transcriptase domain-containing protein [Tanacetum coccineum]